MSLSSATLTALQKVGAAAFSADQKLRKDVSVYAERVNAAVTRTPYDPGNDALIENWKVMARLSKTLVDIEEELKKVFQVASELADGEQASVGDMLVLGAPTRSGRQGVAQPVEATPATVKVSPKTKAAKPVRTTAAAAAKTSARQDVASQADLPPTDVLVKSKKTIATPKAKMKKAKAAVTSDKTAALSGNPAKLFSYLERILNANEFTALSQTVAAQETGIPLGSMTAASKKLMELGRITADQDGKLRLAVAQSNSQPPLAP